MKLTKYQKARLLEFEWDLIDNDIDDDTCWLRVDRDDGEIFDNIKQVLNVPTNTKSIKLLIVATQTK